MLSLLLWRSKLRSINSTLSSPSIKLDSVSLAPGEAGWWPSFASHGGHGGQVCWLHLLSSVAGDGGSRAATAAFLGSFLSAVPSSASCSLTAESAGRAAAAPTLLGACCVPIGVVHPPGLDAMVEAFCSGAVCSRRSTPSGVVPGGAVVDRARMRAVFGGAGAGRRPRRDCIPYLCSKVLCVIVKGPIIILVFFSVLLVMCTPPTAG